MIRQRLRSIPAPATIWHKSRIWPTVSRLTDLWILDSEWVFMLYPQTALHGGRLHNATLYTHSPNICSRRVFWWQGTKAETLKLWFLLRLRCAFALPLARIFHIFTSLMTQRFLPPRNQATSVAGVQVNGGSHNLNLNLFYWMSKNTSREKTCYMELARTDVSSDLQERNCLAYGWPQSLNRLWADFCHKRANANHVCNQWRTTVQKSGCWI